MHSLLLTLKEILLELIFLHLFVLMVMAVGWFLFLASYIIRIGGLNPFRLLKRFEYPPTEGSLPDDAIRAFLKYRRIFLRSFFATLLFWVIVSLAVR